MPPSIIESVFADLDRDAFKKLLDDAPKKDTAESVRKYYDGDHWQGGEGWTGPQPDENDPDFTDTMSNIQLYFVSTNKVAEFVDRHVASVTGSEPSWAIASSILLPPVKDEESGEEKPAEMSPEDQARVIEIDSFFTQWWDDRDVLDKIQDGTTEAVLNEAVYFRPFIPNSDIAPSGTVQEVASRIYLEVIKEGACIHTDRLTQQQCSIVEYKIDDAEFLEVSYLDQGLTVIKVFTSDGVEEAGPFDFGGHLMLIEMRLRRSLITPQVISLQKFLNHNLTVWQRNQGAAGFRERWITNAAPPGEEKQDEKTGRTEFYPGVFSVGATSSNMLVGVSSGIKNAAGGEDVATPGITVIEPVPIATFAETQLKIYNVMTDEVRQPHVKLSEAAVSGRSRIEGKADFRTSVLPTRSAVQTATRNIIETVYSIVACFSGAAGRFNTLRTSVTCKIDLGPFSPEEIEAGLKLVEAEIWSKEFFAQLTGVEDFEAMLAQIRKENPEKGLAVEREQLNLENEKAVQARTNPPQPEPNPAPPVS